MTLYARALAGAVTHSRATLPEVWKYPDGHWVSNPTLPDLAPDGWVLATEVRPALTTGQRYGSPTFTVNGGGAITATYPAVNPSVEETNGDTLRQRATAALTTNATYLAIASPTNAQVAAQVRTLTKESNALIRLALGLLADITDTA